MNSIECLVAYNPLYIGWNRPLWYDPRMYLAKNKKSNVSDFALTGYLTKRLSFLKTERSGAWHVRITWSKNDCSQIRCLSLVVTAAAIMIVSLCNVVYEQGNNDGTCRSHCIHKSSRSQVGGHQFIEFIRVTYYHPITIVI